MRGISSFLPKVGGSSPAKKSEAPSSKSRSSSDSGSSAPSSATSGGSSGVTSPTNRRAEGQWRNRFKGMMPGSGKKQSAASAEAGKRAQAFASANHGLEGEINIPNRGGAQESAPRASADKPAPQQAVATQTSVKEQLSKALKEQKELRAEMAKHEAKSQELIAQQSGVLDRLAMPASPGLNRSSMQAQLQLAHAENPSSAPLPELPRPAQQRSASRSQAAGYQARASDQFKKAETVEKFLADNKGNLPKVGVKQLEQRVADLKARGAELQQLGDVRSPASPPTTSATPAA
jgi:hypothetical protein